MYRSAFHYLILALLLLFGVGSAMRADDAKSTTFSVQTDPTAEPRLDVTGNRIRFRIDEITLIDPLDDEHLENEVLVLIRGRLRSGDPRCLLGADFKLAIADSEYEPSAHWMELLREQIGDWEYPGPQFSAQCISADMTEQSYLVFDVDAIDQPATLRLFDGEVLLGDLTQLALDDAFVLAEATDDEIDPVATVTPSATDIPAVTAAPEATPASTLAPSLLPSEQAEFYFARGVSNVRACPRLSCELVHVMQRGERVEKFAERFGDTVNTVSLWYQIRLENGLTGFAHSILFLPQMP